jgi:hypothetical protein
MINGKKIEENCNMIFMIYIFTKHVTGGKTKREERQNILHLCER